MSTNYANADSLLYLQECINDLQNRFYGLQLEHLQKQEHQKMLQQLPSLNNSIWSTQNSPNLNPYRPPSASSSSSSSTTATGAMSDRDSGAASMRSFSPDLSAASVAQLNAAAAFWPAQAAATAATLAAFMPKGVANAASANAAMLNALQNEQMDELFMQSKQPKMISPIGTGKPKNMGQFAQQHMPPQYGHFDQRANVNTPFQYNKNQRKPIQKKNMNIGNVNKHVKQPEKPKQGPFNKVLIVGLAPEYRSLNGVLDIFRPYGDVVSARVYRPFLTLPPEITRWVPSIELQGAYSAIIEYPTARCAKFAVGVLRERVTTNKYRVVLLKPGAYEELQRQQTLIQTAQSPPKEVEESQSDSGNESFENRSSRSSDCHSD